MVALDAYQFFALSIIVQDVSKELYNFENLYIYIYSGDTYSVLNCHNVAKHTGFTWDSYSSM
jgi:hypothetical protein